MSLKTAGKLGPEKILDEKPSEATKSVPVEEQNTVLLELALYTNYTWQGQTFTKGKAYRFHQKHAMQLLSEQDHGRPVWKQYQKPQPKEQPRNVVVDATAIAETVIAEPIHGIDHTATPGPKRIDIGTDDELAALGLKDDVTI